MNSRDNSEFDDKRLAYMYDFLVKTWKIKTDVIETMMRNPEFSVRIYLDINLSTLGLVIMICIRKSSWGEKC